MSSGFFWTASWAVPTLEFQKRIAVKKEGLTNELPLNSTFAEELADAHCAHAKFASGIRDSHEFTRYYAHAPKYTDCERFCKEASECDKERQGAGPEHLGHSRASGTAIFNASYRVDRIVRPNVPMPPPIS